MVDRLILSILLFATCLTVQGQEKCVSIHENVFFYLTESGNKMQKNTRKDSRNNSLTLTLLIVNQSEDTVRIEHFYKDISHRQDPIRIRIKRAFTWEFFTLSNQIPDDVINFLPHGPVKVRPRNNQAVVEAMEIVVPPNSTFNSDIYLHSEFMSPARGNFYKLRLYYGTEHCVAEMVIKYD
jgi:hypothetical protein